MWKKVKRSEYQRINEMLDLALDGNFQEMDYDESELSKLEVKWKRYLASFKLSAYKMKEEREHIQKLVTNISHQTRTPLANIRLYGQLLSEQPLDEVSMGMVEEILVYSGKLEFLIQSLVNTSRLESGVFQFVPRENDLCELVQYICAAGEERAREKNIHICTVQNTTGFVHVRCDRKWTQEAACNLLDNALKYSPNGAQIYIRVFSYEMFAGIEIQDFGTGIPPEEIPKIFARFYRGTNVHDREGIGVGLYLARQIIEGQGGYIKVLSKVGQGSRFQIYLPRATTNQK